MSFLFEFKEFLVQLEKHVLVDFIKMCFAFILKQFVNSQLFEHFFSEGNNQVFYSTDISDFHRFIVETFLLEV